MELILLFLIAFALLHFGFSKEDYTLTAFSAFIFILTGLFILNHPPEFFVAPYYFYLGAIVIFIGLYIALRVGLETIANNLRFVRRFKNVESKNTIKTSGRRSDRANRK